MQFNSLPFIFLFLPVTPAGYLLLRRTRFANTFMLAASLIFYASSALWYLAPLFATALLDFFIGQKIAESSDERYRKTLLILSVVANLTLLSVFKYTGWLTGNILPAFGLDVPVLALVLRRRSHSTRSSR